MTRLDETARHYCEQQARRAGAVFRLARSFLPGDRAERVVVATAFVETIEAIALEVSDPGVAATKFEWWRQALAGASEAGARHPLVGALGAHGLLSGQRVSLLQAHVGAVASMMDPEPVATPEALFERLSGPGAVRALIAAGAPGDAVPADTLAQHGAVTVALRHLAAAMPDLGAREWWVPMDWRARFAEAGGAGPDAGALLAETAGLLAGWQAQADPALLKAAQHRAAGSGVLEFLALESGLRLRWLRRVASKPEAFLAGSGPTLRWRDAWFAWRRARRVVPRQGGEHR